jgi:quinol monooxygenase YgiN
MAISYCVLVRAKPGRRDELLARFRALADTAITEPGTQLYVFNTVENDPDLVITFELFADADALEAHQSSPVLPAVVEQLRSLVAETTAYRGAPAFGKGLPASR